MLLAKEQNKKVLVIDDSLVIQKSLRNFLEDYGFTVITCTDGLEGIKLATEEQPDLIFLDLMMPNLDGIKMLQVKKVISDIESIPVIVISANTARSNVIAVAEAGAEKVITKPLKKELIKEYVNEILGDNYFAKKPNDRINKFDQEEIKKKLQKTFLDGFIDKKKEITEALMKRDADTFKKAIHELKGAGGTIGVDLITNLSQEIMEKNFESPSDWAFAEMNFNKVLQSIEKLKTELNY